MDEPWATKPGYAVVQHISMKHAAKFCRPPVLYDNDDNDHTALVTRQPYTHADVDTHPDIPFLPLGSPVAGCYEDAGL